MAEWAREKGYSKSVIKGRLNYNWSEKDAILTPVRKRMRKKTLINYKKTNRDANHAEIVTALTEHGYSVYDFSALGGGIPDILVGITCKSGIKINLLIEIKSSKKAHIRRSQNFFQKNWTGQQTLVCSVKDALWICKHHFEND